MVGNRTAEGAHRRRYRRWLTSSRDEWLDQGLEMAIALANVRGCRDRWISYLSPVFVYRVGRQIEICGSRALYAARPPTRAMGQLSAQADSQRRGRSIGAISIASHRR